MQLILGFFWRLKMDKYKLAPGWTKGKVVEQIYKYNNGMVAFERNDASDKNSCTYEANDGNRCFIGCFIPDELREARWSEGNVTKLLGEHPALWSHMPFHEIAALRHFQD